MYLKYMLLLLILISQSSPWRRRRRRRGCSRVDCQVNPWSSWSHCSAVQCRGQSGIKQRVRTIHFLSRCGGTPCPPLQETAPCSGTLRADCRLSSWSTWSACSLVCGGFQTTTRYVLSNGQCGGMPCSLTLNKTRACKVTRCFNQGSIVDGQCSCLPGYYGNCCQFSGGYIK